MCAYVFIDTIMVLIYFYFSITIPRVDSALLWKGSRSLYYSYSIEQIFTIIGIKLSFSAG